MNTDGTVDTVELKRIGLVYCERSCTNDQLCKICVRWLSALKYHMYEIQINCYHSDVSYKVFESVGWSNKLSTTKMCLNQTVINVYLFLPIQVPQHWNASSSDWPMAPRLPQSTTVNLQRKAKNREKRRKVESEKKRDLVPFFSLCHLLFFCWIFFLLELVVSKWRPAFTGKTLSKTFTKLKGQEKKEFERNVPPEIS